MKVSLAKGCGYDKGSLVTTPEGVCAIRCRLHEVEERFVAGSIVWV